MRILCVAEDFPWPAHSGYRIRLGNVIRALAEVGDVDCFFVLNDGMDRPPCVVPADAGVARTQVVQEGPPTSTESRLVRWLTSRRPRTVLWRRWSISPGELREFAPSRYDLVWFSHIDTYLELHDSVSGPAIVDLDTLEDYRLKHELETAAHDPGEEWNQASARRSLSGLVRTGVAHIDVGRWERLQHGVARSVAAVVVCSELDRTRLAEPNCAVVPNGYELPEPPPSLRPAAAGGRPVMTMVGDFHYQPNFDAAWWFARRVLPLVRADHPDAEFRLVGRGDDLGALDREPGVVLRGRVDDISAELRRGRLRGRPAALGRRDAREGARGLRPPAPRRLDHDRMRGSRRRRRRPRAPRGRTVGVRRACSTLIAEPERRARLADATFGLYWDRFRWAELRPGIVRLATDVASRARTAG